MLYRKHSRTRSIAHRRQSGFALEEHIPITECQETKNDRANLSWHSRCCVRVEWESSLKQLGTLLVAYCLLGMGLPAQAYESRGARSCQGWQEFRLAQKKGYSLDAEIYETWLVGYLSGIVAGSGTDFLVSTDNESVFRMVDGFCESNPQMNLSAAGTSVARQLEHDKGIVNRPTLR
jgi:hypothetical protein